MSRITANVERLLRELPAGVELVAVAKTRSAEEVAEAIEAGVRIVGQNYLQEALPVMDALASRYGPDSPRPASWHFIGRLQSNKIGRIADRFQLIETLDRSDHARRLQRLLTERERTLPVLLEINSGREESKSGVLPEAVPELMAELAQCDRVLVKGLMTMGPLTEDADLTRTAFRDTYKLFQTLREVERPGLEMRYLSMGMSASWRIAVEEGANLVRIGAGIFGPRQR